MVIVEAAEIQIRMGVGQSILGCQKQGEKGTGAGNWCTHPLDR